MTKKTEYYNEAYDSLHDDKACSRCGNDDCAEMYYDDYAREWVCDRCDQGASLAFEAGGTYEPW